MNDNELNKLNHNFDYLSESHRRIQTQINDLVLDAGESNQEVVQARGGHQVLNDRLNSIDSQLAQKATKDDIKTLEKVKADQSFVDSQFATIVSGAPTGTYTDLNALREAYPDGAEGVMLVLEDGHWYYWNETAQDWLDGGLYQAVSWEVYMFEPDEEWVI